MAISSFCQFFSLYANPTIWNKGCSGQTDQLTKVPTFIANTSLDSAQFSEAGG